MEVSVNKVIEKIPAPDSKTYSYEKGANSQWIQGSGDGLTFCINCDGDKFRQVKINGAVLETSHYTYTAKSGSTIITLKQEYLKMLKAGVYNLSVEFTDGKADTAFTIKAKSTSSEPADNSRTGGFMILSILSLGAVLYIGRRKK